MRLLSIREVADALGVDPRSIHRWIRAGVVRPKIVTPGGRARFDLAEVERALSPDKTPARRETAEGEGK